MPNAKLLYIKDNFFHCPSFVKPFIITQHAASRIKQRGINEILLSLILSEGKTCIQGNNIIYQLVHRKLRMKLAGKLRAMAEKLEKTPGLFAVVSTDNKLITVGYHFNKKHKRG